MMDAMNCENVRLFMKLMKVINEYVDQEVAEVLRLKEKCEELEKEQEELKKQRDELLNEYKKNWGK